MYMEKVNLLLKGIVYSISEYIETKRGQSLEQLESSELWTLQ